jgi:hypothetical protein
MVTIKEYYDSGKIDSLDDEILLTTWETLSGEVQEKTKEMGIIEMVLQRRMQANNARTLLSTTLTIKLGPPSYDFGKLRVLGEHVPEELLKKGLVEAHKETVIRQVPDKYDMRIINAWKSFGQHIVDIINGAEILDARHISIKHKNPA